jgi:hypothetical protein
VSWHLVIERPKHVPRLLGSFGSREDAETDRVRFLSDHPAWERFVRVVCVRARATPSTNGSV